VAAGFIFVCVKRKAECAWDAWRECCLVMWDRISGR